MKENLLLSVWEIIGGGLREEVNDEISDLRALHEELYQSKPHVCAVEGGSGKPMIHFAAILFLLKWFCRIYIY